MQTKFDIGDKVYFDLPQGWGWVESIRILKEHIAYEIRMPDGTIHYKIEQALRKEYGRTEKQER